MTSSGQDLSHYDADYYRRDTDENWFIDRGLLRPDQLAALCYTFNLFFWGDESYWDLGRRMPGRIMSVGCGRGDLEVCLESLGHPVIGVDPTAGARELYRGSNLQVTPEWVETCKTIIFCESIEHIPRELTDRIIERAPIGARVIIVNWPTYHPIEPTPDGWNHITRTDDQMYDELAEGFRIWVRRGSHLVMDKERQRVG